MKSLLKSGVLMNVGKKPTKLSKSQKSEHSGYTRRLEEGRERMALPARGALYSPQRVAHAMRNHYDGSLNCCDVSAVVNSNYRT